MGDILLCITMVGVFLFCYYLVSRIGRHPNKQERAKRRRSSGEKKCCLSGRFFR